MKAPLHTMSCRLHTMAGRRGTGTALAVLMALAALAYSPADAAPVAVRFPEGMTHGFLLVRSLAGEILGQGEMTQVVKEGDLVENQLVFRFKDGSLHDEKVAFSQQRVFTMISYRLVQSGPSFPDQIDDLHRPRHSGIHGALTSGGGWERRGADRAGRSAQGCLQRHAHHRVKEPTEGRRRNGERARVHAGAPSHQTCSCVPWMSNPSTLATLSSKATQYIFTPQIGMIREFVGKATGKLPAQFHYTCWILVDEAPSFVQFEGPLQLMGPIVRIELVSPRLLTKSEDKKISSR